MLIKREPHIRKIDLYVNICNDLSIEMDVALLHLKI